MEGTIVMDKERISTNRLKAAVEKTGLKLASRKGCDEEAACPFSQVMIAEGLATHEDVIEKSKYGYLPNLILARAGIHPVYVSAFFSGLNGWRKNGVAEARSWEYRVGYLDGTNVAKEYGDGLSISKITPSQRFMELLNLAERG